MNPTALPHDPKLISRLFFRLLPIQILLIMITAVNGIVSGMFASNFIGATAMSAIGLYAPITMLLSAVTTTLLGGAQILCGEYMGENLMERTQNIFSIDLLITTLISAIVMAVLAVAALFDLTRVMTADAEVREILNQYILGQIPGIPALLLGQQLSAFLSLENQTRRTTIASVAYVVANLALDFLFVVALKLGALGLALATTLGLWVFFGVQARYYFTGKSQMKLSLRGIQWSDGRSIFLIGVPSGLHNAYEALRGVIVNGLILHYVGSVGLSAFAASDSLLRIFWAVPMGMLSVSRMLFGICIGEEDRQSLADVMRVAMFKCIPIQCAISAAIILCAGPLTGLFYRDAADPVYHMTMMAFRLLPLCMPLSIISLEFTCYGQASEKKLLVQLLSALDGCVFVAGFSALLVPSMGMNGVYIANFLNGLCCAAVVMIYAWACNRHFPRNMEELMVIPDSFGAAPDMRLDITVRQMSEVLKVSRQVGAFLREKGVDERRTYFGSLCLEEMAGNVVQYGFAQDHRRHSVDIRVVCKDGDVIFRIRDDCVSFDPSTRQNIVDPQDQFANAGIRLVYKMAKDVQYQNMLGLNVLTIRA